mmetsp:Transcript_22762/g.36657  ORF Transcript_22762/g.36657 Transcript_22762/m.36657 type:complete len:84 (-) Transcript_22762:242-493(-)
MVEVFTSLTHYQTFFSQIEQDMANAVKFANKKKISDKVIHLQGRVPEINQYGLRYIPHMCVVDKEGKVVMNYNGDAYAALAKL